MCSNGFFKRFLPFFATFVIGVFIASFFVDLSTPRFGRGRWIRREMNEMRMENQRLRDENQQLKEKLDVRLGGGSGSSSGDYGNERGMNLDIPGLVPPPALPAARKIHR